MKAEIILKALRCYEMSADCSDDEREFVSGALEELELVIDRYEHRDTWHDDVEIITLPTLIDILNELTYDDYGRCAKQHGDKMDMYMYMQAAIEKHTTAISGLTDAQLATGYGFISDLWHDNEAAGSNNADGTFSKS